ncbi:MAG TPA: AAA family ATPase [Phycisphaerae bacterium]|nr:AAA family ATPase [Phycisphaerae bacterium]
MTDTQTLVDPTTNQEVPSAFARLGVETGFKPWEPEELGIILLSWSGEGKTTWASSIPHSLLIDFGNNAAGVVAPKAHRVWIKTYAQWNTLRDTLVAQAKAGKCYYNRVTIDTADEWFGILAEKVIEDYNSHAKRKAEDIGEVGQEGKGFGGVGVLMAHELRTLRAAGLGWLVTGHLQEKKVNDATMIRPVLAPSSFKYLVQAAHVKAQIEVDMTFYREAQVKVGDKLITTKKKLDVPTRDYSLRIRTAEPGDEVKCRLPHLPERVPFPRHGAWDAFVEAYRKAAADGIAEETALRAQGT